MGRVVCIDTHILIWGVQRRAKSSQEAMIERTINFLDWLQNEQQAVVVPTPVLTEFLMKIPQSDHNKITREIESRFIVLPYDAAAASMNAHIWQTNKNYGLHSELDDRDRIKTDSMIVAVAVVNGVKILYSEDLGLQKIAKGFIETRGIPLIPRQLELTDQ